MKTRLAFRLLLVAASAGLMAGCYAPPAPPPPRVHATYQAPVYQPPRVAVQFVTAETGLTTEQIENRRHDALNFLRKNGYLRDPDVIVDDASVADRVLFVSPSQQIGGGFDVRVFTPGESTHTASDSYSNLLDDYWAEPPTNVLYVRPRPYLSDWWHRDPFFHDPFSPRSSFHFSYRHHYWRPHYPRYYGPVLGHPHRHSPWRHRRW